MNGALLNGSHGGQSRRSTGWIIINRHCGAAQDGRLRDEQVVISRLLDCRDRLIAFGIELLEQQLICLLTTIVAAVLLLG